MLRNVSSAPPTRLAFALSRKRLADPHKGRAIAYGISNTWAQLAEKFSNRNRLRTAIFESGEAGRRNNGIELLASSIRFFICDSPAPQGGKVSNSAALLRCL